MSFESEFDINVVRIQSLCIPTVLVAILCLIACGYMFYDIYKMKKNRIYHARHETDDKIIRIIIWMTISNVGESIWIIINWSPQIFVPKQFPYWNDTNCYILGLWGQFWMINEVCCHFLVAFCLLIVLITHQRLSDTLKYDLFAMICIYMVCTFLTLVPTVKGKYGDYINASNVNEQECWLSDKLYGLTLYIPVLIGIVFHYIVLIVAFVKWQKTRAFTSAFKVLFQRLFAFALVYSVVNIPCVIVRIWAISKTPPLSLIILHHICLSGRGVGNGIAWYINRNCTDVSNRKHSKHLPLIEQSQDDDPAAVTGPQSMITHAQSQLVPIQETMSSLVETMPIKYEDPNENIEGIESDPDNI
mmetsp:Transcript_75577/g.92847  ORF Transcript_75577/g.92847 Transcript_75577/m.92847 type:complete len:359 (+) Transcript_75577:22-1098(+)